MGKRLDKLFEDNFKSYYSFGRSGVRYSENQMKNLSQEEIQEMLDSDGVTFTELLPSHKIIEKYKDKLTKEQVQQLENWGNKTLDGL